MDFECKKKFWACLQKHNFPEEIFELLEEKYKLQRYYFMYFTYKKLKEYTILMWGYIP